MRKYYVEKFNASDDSYKITGIYTEAETIVSKGDILFSLESSKTSIDIESQESGIIYFIICVGDIINVGQLVYIISDTKIDTWKDQFNIERNNSPNSDSGLTITNKAKILLEKNNIDPKLLNKKVIKEADVNNYLNNSLGYKPILFDRSLISNNLSIGEHKAVIIIGARGGAKMCIDALRESTQFSIIGLIDDNIAPGNKVLGYPVIGNFNAFEELISMGIANFILAFGIIANRKDRHALYLKMKRLGARFPNIIHPKSIVEDSCEIGEGNVILAGANIGSCVKLGNLNYINNNSVVSHDCILKDNVHISPGAVLASSIAVDSHVLIGMNTTLYMGIKIGENSTITNGLIINHDVESNHFQKSNN